MSNIITAPQDKITITKFICGMVINNRIEINIETVWSPGFCNNDRNEFLSLKCCKFFSCSSSEIDDVLGNKGVAVFQVQIILFSYSEN